MRDTRPTPTIDLGFTKLSAVPMVRSIAYPTHALLPGTRSRLEKYVAERCFACARPINECECGEPVAA